LASAAVEATGTAALASAAVPFVLQIANLGWLEACRRCGALRQGLNLARGRVFHAGVAEAFGLPLASFSELLPGQNNPTIRA
ncbi:hypothetical protein ENH_00005020, partial [Eimeria necatrix]